MTKTKWFDENGWLVGQIPKQCIRDCSQAGAVDDAVARWVEQLDFDCPEPQAAKWLREFGAWDAEELADHEANNRRVLWIACCDIKEQGEWLGLIH